MPSGFIGAVQFLTRVPVRTSRAVSLTVAAPWLPVAGALIGAVVGGIAAGVMEVSSPLVGAAVAVLMGILITGAFHEDGLADTADAIAGGPTTERRNEILKDSRHGSYGVAALCGSIVLRVACVASLGPAAAFAGLLGAHALGRAGAVGAMTFMSPSHSAGLAATAASVRRIPAVMGIVAAIVVTAAATGLWVLVLVGTAALVTVMVATVARRAFGGSNGDVLGAVEQTIEMTVLIAVTILARRSGLWWT